MSCIISYIPVIIIGLCTGSLISWLANRYCQRSISWQYPLTAATTVVLFTLCFKVFGPTMYCIGMVIFSSALIAVSITDLKEKIIPHDITYPSILLGIFFSAVVRHDLLGTLAGIGASYIIFDFLAHYGLKLYLFMHRADQSLGVSTMDLAERETLEVMGGGDAVLAAMIAAWLGWQRLLVAIILGFFFGTIVGLTLLIKEIVQAKALQPCTKPLLTGALIGGLILIGLLEVLSYCVGIHVPGLSLVIAGALGCLVGGLTTLCFVGSKFSKPFPFGPSLALGGLIAALYNSLLR